MIILVYCALCILAVDADANPVGRAAYDFKLRAAAVLDLTLSARLLAFRFFTTHFITRYLDLSSSPAVSSQTVYLPHRRSPHRKDGVDLTFLIPPTSANRFTLPAVAFPTRLSTIGTQWQPEVLLE